MAVVEQVWERFVTALLPLREAGKFGAVLFQFPRWFPIGKHNKEHILESASGTANPYESQWSSATGPG
jgi:uncharacterized protein YecE (DUF72 family)